MTHGCVWCGWVEVRTLLESRQFDVSAEDKASQLHQQIVENILPPPSSAFFVISSQGLEQVAKAVPSPLVCGSHGMLMPVVVFSRCRHFGRVVSGAVLPEY